ncbi:hypothetical protein BaRGS_00001953, partial [Batillaria attramentaria]
IRGKSSYPPTTPPPNPITDFMFKAFDAGKQRDPQVCRLLGQKIQNNRPPRRGGRSDSRAPRLKRLPTMTAANTAGRFSSGNVAMAVFPPLLAGDRFRSSSCWVEWGKAVVKRAEGGGGDEDGK